MVLGRTGSYFESPYNDEVDLLEYNEEFNATLTFSGKVCLLEGDNKTEEVKDLFKSFTEQLKEIGVELEEFDLNE